MAKVEFIKEDIVNGIVYKEGDTLSVSASIYNRLVKNNSIKTTENVEPVEETETTENVEPVEETETTENVEPVEETETVKKTEKKAK